MQEIYRKKSIAMIHSKAIVWHPEETPINNSDKDETGQESRKVCILSLGGYSLAMLLNKNLQVSLVKNAESLHIPMHRKPSDRRGPCSGPSALESVSSKRAPGSSSSGSIQEL